MTNHNGCFPCLGCDTKAKQTVRGRRYGKGDQKRRQGRDQDFQGGQKERLAS